MKVRSISTMHQRLTRRDKCSQRCKFPWFLPLQEWEVRVLGGSRSNALNSRWSGFQALRPHWGSSGRAVPGWVQRLYWCRQNPSPIRYQDWPHHRWWVARNTNDRASARRDVRQEPWAGGALLQSESLCKVPRLLLVPVKRARSVHKLVGCR